MENFFKEIDNFIIESNKEISEKILGINYLEKLKFSLIEKIKGLNINSYEDIQISDLLDVIKKSDLLFKLVDHKEFKFLKSDQRKIYDFSNK